MAEYIDNNKNISISADSLNIGENVSFGSDIKIDVRGTFEIGNYSRLGSNTEILGHDIILGEHLFNSSGLRVGGGGRQNPNASLKIGDRCTIHNNFINVCENIDIGNDVGLSPETSILSHGYWLSVLDGFPASFSSVSIGNGVIVGYRSLVMMGVSIPSECVVGAQSVVSKTLHKKGIYAGSPAKFIRDIEPLSLDKKINRMKAIIKEYHSIAEYHGVLDSKNIKLKFPMLKFKAFEINVEDMTFDGREDEDTDDLRDFLRKWGIRIYTKRPFRSKNPIL